MRTIPCRKPASHRQFQHFVIGVASRHFVIHRKPQSDGFAQVGLQLVKRSALGETARGKAGASAQKPPSSAWWTMAFNIMRYFIAQFRQPLKGANPNSNIVHISSTRHLPSPIAIRPFHCESVRQVPHFSHRALLRQDLHNVEAHPHRWISRQSQVIKRSPCQPAAPFRVHCRHRPCPFFRGTGFNFDEYQAVCIIWRKL